MWGWVSLAVIRWRGACAPKLPTAVRPGLCRLVRTSRRKDGDARLMRERAGDAVLATTDKAAATSMHTCMDARGRSISLGECPRPPAASRARDAARSCPPVQRRMGVALLEVNLDTMGELRRRALSWWRSVVPLAGAGSAAGVATVDAATAAADAVALAASDVDDPDALTPAFPAVECAWTVLRRSGVLHIRHGAPRRPIRRGRRHVSGTVRALYAAPRDHGNPSRV